MFDAVLRRLIDPPLDAAARRLKAAPLGADAVTLAGFAVGLLATEIARPNTNPDCQVQPKTIATTSPSTVASRLWPTAPGMAIRRTDSSSSR